MFDGQANLIALIMAHVTPEILLGGQRLHCACCSIDRKDIELLCRINKLAIIKHFDPLECLISGRLLFTLALIELPLIKGNVASCDHLINRWYPYMIYVGSLIANKISYMAARLDFEVSTVLPGCAITVKWIRSTAVSIDSTPIWAKIGSPVPDLR
jgi:hypothetical protein